MGLSSVSLSLYNILPGSIHIITQNAVSYQPIQLGAYYTQH